uniref:ATP synthase complex subunit 8 n=1 Tax=Sacculina sp. 'Beibu Gulf' TaxID=2861897 RepID=A0A8F9R9E7_9CRUS|nr:ATP synthase F0 subunit 8 [Sacculina sp. 'Beibu Gulf']
MPQLSPMNWLFIFFMLILSLTFILVTLNYYIYFYNKSSKVVKSCKILKKFLW